MSEMRAQTSRLARACMKLCKSITCAYRSTLTHYNTLVLEHAASNAKYFVLRRIVSSTLEV
jgi:hypothetical protein